MPIDYDTDNTNPLNAAAKAAVRDSIVRELTGKTLTVDQAADAAAEAAISTLQPFVEAKLDDKDGSTRTAYSALDKTMTRKIDGDDLIATVKEWWIEQHQSGERSDTFMQLGSLLAAHRTYTEADIVLDESGEFQARTDNEDYIVEAAS